MYDATIGYDNSLDTNTASGLNECLAWIGLASMIRRIDIFKDPNLSRLMLSKHIIQKYSEMISDQSYLNVICTSAFRNKINLYQQPNWTNFLEKMVLHGLKDPIVADSASRAADHYINFYLDWNGDNVDWMDIYSIYYNNVKRYGYSTPPYVKVLEKFFKENPLCARTVIEAELFEADTKPEVAIRSEMYSAYIKAGFLDRKKARKIRSESSENASYHALSCLIHTVKENEKLYPNYHEMLLQFSDTKYYSVQNLLAGNAPYSLLYAFVGFDSNNAKTIIEKRMQNGK